MSDVIDDDLYRRTKRLLEPGAIELVGAIVHTDYGGDEDIEMTQTTVDIGEIIADHATDEDTYVYSGMDDSNFASNQHQGLTLADDAFVWECQQLLRNGTFDLVFYYEASVDHERIVDDIEKRGFEVTAVE